MMKTLKFFLPVLVALLTTGCKEEKKAGLPLLPAANFEQEIDGKAVSLYTLTNASGMTMQVTNFGTRIVSLWVPDRDGQFRDVVLGRNTLDEYLTSDEKFYGATVGRYANRIAGGHFAIDGQTYRLDVNDGVNHLHGGSKGYFNVVWDAYPYKTNAGEDAIRFTYSSPDGEMGYPGNVTATVVMTLTAAGALQISYDATTDAPTVINLSHHSYFNLSGEGAETIGDHALTIHASAYTPTDGTLIPTGEIAPVGGTPLDFTTEHPVGERIGEDFEALKLGGGYDHNWVIDGTGMRPAAVIYSPVSGIEMAVHTDQPGIQFYSGNFMTGKDTGKSGKPYGYRSAFCLETQKFPDSPNHPDFPSTVLRPGERYLAYCYYVFGVR
jgi:aldose 1-epimerase